MLELFQMMNFLNKNYNNIFNNKFYNNIKWKIINKDQFNGKYNI